VIAEALAVASERLGDAAPGVLARLGGPLGHETRTAHAELGRVEAAVRKRRRAEVAAAVRAPLPAGLRRLHPSWLEAALDELPRRARTAVAAPSADPIDVWLARWATASLPPLRDGDVRDVLDWLTEVGADQLAYALGEQATAMPALAAARVRIHEPPRADQLGPRRAAIARCRGVSLDDDLALVRIACRALAPHLATNQLAALELIRKLPRPIGFVVARELAAHAATSFDECPTWAALAAR
jgi:hypothetical protein